MWMFLKVFPQTNPSNPRTPIFLAFFGFQEIFIQDDAPDFSIGSDESLSVLITFVVLTLIGGVLATSMLWGRKEAENTYFYLTNKKLMILKAI